MVSGGSGTASGMRGAVPNDRPSTLRGVGGRPPSLCGSARSSFFGDFSRFSMRQMTDQTSQRAAARVPVYVTVITRLQVILMQVLITVRRALPPTAASPGPPCSLRAESAAKAWSFQEKPRGHTRGQETQKAARSSTCGTAGAKEDELLIAAQPLRKVSVCVIQQTCLLWPRG